MTQKLRIYLPLILFILILGGCSRNTGPSITLDKTEFSADEIINVHFSGTDEKDWIGFYHERYDPGSIETITWQYAIGEGTVTFDASSLGNAGVYWIFLCDNDSYKVLDQKEITLLDSDTTDYGAKSADLSASIENGYTHIEVSVTPGTEKDVTYSFYWSVGGKRLAGYLPIYTTNHSGGEEFTVSFNDCLFMPHEADGIEIAVTNGASESVFASAPEELIPAKSKLLYKFSVISDMHISPSYPQRAVRLSQAFGDILAEGNVSAIFTCGDNTKAGLADEYDMLLDTVSAAGRRLPPIYYAMGNHDIVYSDAEFEEEVELFKDKTGMSGIYYSVDMKGSKFIVLGSDTPSEEGTIGQEQLDWFKAELASVGKYDTVYIFLHQPLIDTVSGSLYSYDNNVQIWYGIYETADALREILAEYPNAFLFTGHTHFSLESKQPILAGRGKDANFVNCASVGYLWDESDTLIGGSEGYIVEVYEDYILLRGREFMLDSWCAAAQFLIPLTGQTNQ